MSVVLPYLCLALIMAVPLLWALWIFKEDARRRAAYREDCERIRRGEPRRNEWKEWRLW